MNNELDKYLHTVAHELRGLEAQQREAELHEMRVHLEAIVARLMDGGASETEATEAAIAQFGAAHKVGRELEQASEVRKGMSIKRTLSAMALWGMGGALVFVAGSYLYWHGAGPLPTPNDPRDPISYIAFIATLKISAILGGITGAPLGFLRVFLTRNSRTAISA